MEDPKNVENIRDKNVVNNPENSQNNKNNHQDTLLRTKRLFTMFIRLTTATCRSKSYANAVANL